MFCSKCGKPTPDGQTVCDACAAPAVEAEEIVTAAPEAPVEDAQPIELNTPDFQPPKKKKKGGLIALIAAGVAVVALALVMIFCWANVASFFNRTFSSPEKYLVKVESKAIAESADSICEIYGEGRQAYTSDFATSGDAQLRLTLGKQILSLAESYLASEGMDSDLSWLSDIVVNMEMVMEEDGAQVTAGIGLDDTEVLSADVVLDGKTNTGYVGLPDMSDTYVRFDLEETAGMDYSEIWQEMQSSQQTSALIMRCLPEEEALEEMINTYAALILAEIDEVEKSSETISVGGASQRVTVLTATISQEDLCDMGIAVLQKAQTDPAVAQILLNLNSAMKELYGDDFSEDLHSEIISAMGQAIQSMQSSRTTSEIGNYIQLTTYVDHKDNITGRKIVVFSTGNAPVELLRYNTITKRNRTTVDAHLNAGIFTGDPENYESLQITGESTESKGITDGTYRVIYQGSTVVTLGVQSDESVEGVSSCTVRITPGQEIMDSILDSMDLGIPSSVLSDDLALAVSFRSSGNSGSISVNIMSGSESLIGISLSASDSSNELTIPSKSFDVEDNVEGYIWLSSLDFAGLFQRMEQAGVPEDLVSALQMAMYGGSY